MLSGRPGPELIPVDHLVDPADPANPTGPANPANPANSANPAGPAGPANPAGSANPAGPRAAYSPHTAPTVPFAELHAVSAYSFLSDTGGASEPEELVTRAHELGLSALGLLDRDGFLSLIHI